MVNIEENKKYTFNQLVRDVSFVHNITSSSARSAVNQLLTIRNWIIGAYIVEYEQKGCDKAEYGSHLLENLSKSLRIKGLERNQLNLCRIFYLKYPQIYSTVSSKLEQGYLLPGMSKLLNEKGLADNMKKCSTASSRFETPPDILVSKLSFSHIREIMTLDDPFERFFYEIECIKGIWSVRELRRQISSNLYFRAGISQKPELLIENLDEVGCNPEISIKDPFAFEFLGIEAKEVVSETDLEKALMDHLQDFLLEMGTGFCFEARQKRILIDDDYYFPDLILYNRILHCSVIVELKNEEFSHENLGQLDAYVSYYKENEMYEGDNPPIGILLCTRKGKKMVEYAKAGMDNNLFVSTYMLHLPDKSQLEEFLIRELREIGI